MRINSFKLKNASKFKLFFKYYAIAAKTILLSPLAMFLGVYLNILILLSWLTFKQGDSFLLSSVVGTGIIRNGMYTFLRSLLNNKRTGVNHRMKCLPVSRFFEAFAYIVWNFTFNIACSALFLVIGVSIFSQQREIIQHVNWLMFMSGYILLWISSIILAYILYTVIKTPDTAHATAIIVYCITYSFFGFAFPYSTVVENHFINYSLYLFPQRYALNILQAGWVNAKNMIFIHGNEHVDFGFNGHTWIAYLCAMLLILAMVLSIILYYVKKYLDFKKNQYKNYGLIKQNLFYINQIKKASSIEELKKIQEDMKINQETEQPS